MNFNNSNVIVRNNPCDQNYFNNNFNSHNNNNNNLNDTRSSNPQQQRNIIYGYALPKIAIKSAGSDRNFNRGNAENEQVVLVNGCWDISGSNRIPNIIAEMHHQQQGPPPSALSSTESTISIMNSHVNSNGTASLNKADFLLLNPNSPVNGGGGSDSGIESDYGCAEQGNLSWLLNYKINELPPVPDSNTSTEGAYQQISSNPDFSAIKGCRDQKNEFQGSNNVRSLCNGGSIDSNDEDNNNQQQQQSYSRYAGPKKPPFTYTELIEHALSEKGELTVSGIYQWISEHFPFYKQNDDRWKNSVRHNLSINPHFRKGSKAVHGAGHLWTIAQKDDRKSWQLKKQRMQQFIQTYKDSAATGAHNIGDCSSLSSEQDAFEIELKAATASILGETFNDLDQQSVMHTDNTRMRQQDIEVEFINVVDVQNGLEDFLSPPVSKQQIVQECGLGGDFLITSLNPNTLGINICDNTNGGGTVGGAGEIINDGSFYDDMSLEYYELEKE